MLKVPDKLAPEHAGNVLQVPSKKQADNVFQVPTKKSEPEKAPEPEPEPAPVEEVAPAVNVEEMLAEFASGNKLGEDLKQWVEENAASMPSVEKLVFHYLEEKQQKNPDIECGWADPSQYGAAFLHLCEDNLYNQMGMLFGIQKYCDKLGFPKLNDEYVVQAMFRAMYKYDLALDDAFAEWKEDESAEHDAGKLKAVIQTVSWFNWLEEDDDDEEGEEEE